MLSTQLRPLNDESYDLANESFCDFYNSPKSSKLSTDPIQMIFASSQAKVLKF